MYFYFKSDLFLMKRLLQCCIVLIPATYALILYRNLILEPLVKIYKIPFLRRRVIRMHSNSLLINRKNTLGRAQLNIVSWKRRMDLREFYQDFVTQWYRGDTSSAFVRKCRLLLEKAAEFFESAAQEVKKI